MDSAAWDACVRFTLARQARGFRPVFDPSRHFLAALPLLFEFVKLQRAGRGESPEAWALADRMDAPWYAATELERALLRQISAHLYEEEESEMHQKIVKVTPELLGVVAKEHPSAAEALGKLKEIPYAEGAGVVRLDCRALSPVGPADGFTRSTVHGGPELIVLATDEMRRCLLGEVLLPARESAAPADGRIKVTPELLQYVARHNFPAAVAIMTLDGEVPYRTTAKRVGLDCSALPPPVDMTAFDRAVDHGGPVLILDRTPELEALLSPSASGRRPVPDPVFRAAVYLDSKVHAADKYPIALDANGDVIGMDMLNMVLLEAQPVGVEEDRSVVAAVYDDKTNELTGFIPFPYRPVA